uniref:Uncharacterized protein n=1 Tax=Arundo donax TaxID=35708 RepID=A0A0A8XTW2_ARUDO
MKGFQFKFDHFSIFCTVASNSCHGGRAM